MQHLQSLFTQAFTALNLDIQHSLISISNRPDLCDYQCNGAMALAKQAKQPPKQLGEAILESVTVLLASQNLTERYSLAIAGPGFINIKVADTYLAELLTTQLHDERLSCELASQPKTLVLDFGGPNVAKAMHVGHLRCAIIGESLQRMAQFLGHKTISDVHLGDWGLPYGKTILELKHQQPDLPYFQPNFVEDDPTQPPVSLEALNRLYREGNERCKNDETALNEARQITAQMQKGQVGYTALWKQFVNISVQAIRKNYDRLAINFDYWYGESDAYAYIDKVEHKLKSRNLLVESQGAQVIHVAEAADGENPLPPLLFYKNDGAVTYGSTDLATILQRQLDFAPDEILYVVDQRQSMHFKQVFRAAEKVGFLEKAKGGATQLIHIGYGTINGADGKPLKTRDGQQIILEDMLDQVLQASKLLLPNATDEPGLSQAELDALAEQIAMAAIKFNDMKNNTATDYAFDINQCTRFEGKTGPYLQYAVARINSILDKASENESATTNTTTQITLQNEFERKLGFTLLQTGQAIHKAFGKHEPSLLCDHAYEVAQIFSRFYAECPILNQPAGIQCSRLALVRLTKAVLTLELKLLGIATPHKIYTQREISA